MTDVIKVTDLSGFLQNCFGNVHQREIVIPENATITEITECDKIFVQIRIVNRRVKEQIKDFSLYTPKIVDSEGPTGIEILGENENIYLLNILPDSWFVQPSSIKQIINQDGSVGVCFELQRVVDGNAGRDGLGQKLLSFIQDREHYFKFYLNEHTQGAGSWLSMSMAFNKCEDPLVIHLDSNNLRIENPSND